MSNPITNLNPNDVLLGRGSGINEYVGNQRFRALVDERKEEYNFYSQNELKRKVAQSVLDRIHSLGGRFLRIRDDDTNEQEEFIVESSDWQECEEDVALEKIKQRLREKVYESKNGTDGSKKRTLMTTFDESASDLTFPGTVTSSPEAALGIIVGSTIGVSSSLPLNPTVLFPALPSGIPFFPTHMPSNSLPFGPTGTPPMMGSSVDPHLLLFPPIVFALGSSNINGSIQNPSFSAIRPDAQISFTTPANDMQSDPPAPDLRQQDTAENAPGPSSLPKSSSWMNRVSIDEGESADDDVSQYILASLALSDQKIITDEQVALEKALLTDSERAEALSDLFGQMCSVDFRESKKPRRDLDRDSIEFLVKQMWIQIDAIPKNKKAALLEAKENGRPEEFTDDRLEKFLRCEGMNAKLAAQRFTTYWEHRRSVFGEEKYLLPMTLTEAFRDDLEALAAGMYCALPHCDSAGRAMILWNPPAHTGEGYSPDSMVRAVWYVSEVIAQTNIHVGGGVVELVSSSKATIWDYDAKVYPRMTFLQKNAWPVRIVAHHVCSPSSLLVRFVKPVMMALKSKSGRTRTQVHDVPEDKIAESLSSYGILDSMLPTELGGSVNLDQAAWIAQRRAAEMEEI